MDPYSHQIRKLRALAGACRWAWNHFLHYREDAYLAARSAEGSLPVGAFSYVANARELTRLRRMLPWLASADITGLQQTLRDLDGAYAKFFSGEAGHPKPRHGGDDRYRVCGQASFGVDGEWVRLPKLGWVRFRRSRDMPKGARILNITVSRERDRWGISFCAEHLLVVGEAPRGAPVGLDLGTVRSVAFSAATAPFPMPVATPAEEQFGRRLARQVSRKVKGSKRRRKAEARLAKHRRHIARRVRDAAHKLTTHLATTRSEIHVEALRLRAMTASAAGTVEEPGTKVRQKARLNRKMLANAHGQTVAMLKYKCARSGAMLHFKDPAHTSQECAECHHMAPENRPSQAVFLCATCGHQDNADRNAARVVLSRPALPPPDRRVAAHRGKRKTTRKGCGPADVRTHPRDHGLPAPGSTGIPAKAAQAA